MKIKYEFWRHLSVHQRCVVEVEVPDAYASDAYAPDSLAGAHMRAHQHEMPWQISSQSTERNGYHRVQDEAAA